MPDAHATSRKGARTTDPAQWVERHGDALFRYAMMRLRDREVAEEVVQDCFLAALQARDQFTGTSSERTWLIAILKHKVIDRIRADAARRSREQTADSADAVDPFNARGLWNIKVNKWRDDPGSLAQDEEFRQTLANCIGKLPDNFAVPFILREIDGVDSKEICKVLDMSPTNLWARLHRARLRLRTCLEKNWFGK
ncbi:MAG: sigma-70 family RNA polymerase sigma factor [Phycisphaerales bacterium]|nr:sigma-70 family RNA polymerase sigma factor [Phycisphaerales bacterium]